MRDGSSDTAGIIHVDLI